MAGLLSEGSRDEGYGMKALGFARFLSGNGGIPANLLHQVHSAMPNRTDFIGYNQPMDNLYKNRTPPSVVNTWPVATPFPAHLSEQTLAPDVSGIEGCRNTTRAERRNLKLPTGP
jgi:hypothetical protein